MRKPVVDYRQFRLSRVNEPRFAHLKLLLGWVGYFILYFLTENLIPVENCHVMHGRLDDIVPFCEAFVIPYVGWYALIVFSLGYFALYDIDSFKKLMKFIIITQVIAMFIYIVYPNRQDLRPEQFPRDNFLTQIVALLYRFDTSTNVCPSLHVGYSLGIASVWLKLKNEPVWLRGFVVVFVILVCMSVLFIKQHSIIDVYVAIPMCMIAEIIVFGKYWKDRFGARRR